MTKKHNPGFEKICEDARSRVKEVSVDDVHQALKVPDFILIDVREDHEWNEGHIDGAVHLGKGIIERDIETKVPNHTSKLILYCGGGYRSALAAESLQKMGYTNVFSMAGGIRGWKDKNLEVIGSKSK